jgi:Fe-S-cluster containining protein
MSVAMKMPMHDEIMANWKKYANKEKAHGLIYEFLRDIDQLGVCDRNVKHLMVKENKTPLDDVMLEYFRRLQEIHSDIRKRGLELHDETFRCVDCQKCANCCKVYPAVVLTKADRRRIAKHLGLSVDKFLRRYGDERGDINAQPCPFLKDNLCSIYQVRPEICRRYPSTQDKEFWEKDLRGALLLAENCPAVFRILEALRQEFHEELKAMKLD